MSSRLVRTAGGRVCAVVITTPDLPGLERGLRFKVLGDQIGSTNGAQFATADCPVDSVGADTC